MLQNALLNIYGLGPKFGAFFAEAAFSKFVDPKTKTVSLCDLLTNIHRTDQPSGKAGIEHAASLTRLDRPTFDHTADNTQRSPVPSQVAVLLNSTFLPMITVSNVVQTRERLWALTYKKNPSLATDKLKPVEHIIASTEACLLLGVLSGNSNQGKLQISKDYARSILLDERLPAGWKKSSVPMGWPQVAGCLAELGATWAGNRITAMLTLAKNWIMFN
jgi:hypothetical protein